MPEDQPKVQIGFRGTEAYRKILAQEALDRGIKVQELIETAVDSYLKATAAEPEQTAQKSRNLEVVNATIPEKNSGVHLTWEHSYLSDILQSAHEIAKEAIRKNLIAFRELATGKASDEAAPGERNQDAGEERLSPAEVERIRREDRAARQLADDTAKTRPQHETPGARRKTPPKRTGSGR